jgi:hypothetical protein
MNKKQLKQLVKETIKEIQSVGIPKVKSSPTKFDSSKLDSVEDIVDAISSGKLDPEEGKTMIQRLIYRAESNGQLSGGGCRY